NDSHALELARGAVAALAPAPRLALAQTKAREPLHPIEQLEELVPVDLKKQYDVREVLARILDGSELHEFKPRYGETLVTGFGRLAGMPIGVLANNGVLFSQSALKGAHFIELCCQRRTPI